MHVPESDCACRGIQVPALAHSCYVKLLARFKSADAEDVEMDRLQWIRLA
jgi:hypothetical protein